MNCRLKVAIERIEKPYELANVLAEYVAFTVKNRVSFLKAMKKGIELTEQTQN